MSDARSSAPSGPGGARAPWMPAHGMRKLSRRERALRRELAQSEFIVDVEVAYGSTRHLRPIGGKPPLGEYLLDLWQRRHFIWREARSRVSTKNSGDRLGSAWLVLRPMLDAAFYWVLFGLVLNASRGLPNYPAFVLVGIFMFQMTSAAMNGGTGAIKGARSMIRAFSFPRASIIVASLLRDLLERVPAIIVMFIAIALIPPHALPGPTWLLFPAVLVLQLLMDFGVMLIFARIGHSVPDIAHGVQFGVRILFYLSGVVFPIDRFLDHPVALTVIEANPIYVMLQAYRAILIDGAVPDWTVWTQLVAWAAGLAVLGFLLFWRAEESYGRE